MSEIPKACISTEISGSSCISTEISGSACISTEINSTACIDTTKPIDFDYEIYQEAENYIGFVAYNETTNGLHGVIEVEES